MNNSQFTQNTIKEWRKEFCDSEGNFDPNYEVHPFISSDLEDWLSSKLEEAQKAGEERMAKAFGNCRKCYGKGYATYRHGYRAEADMLGSEEQEDPFETRMIFCTCDRGKQLKQLSQSEEKEG